MLDCIKHMTTIGKWRKPIFIGPHTDCYSRKKYGRGLFFELEEILEVDPKIKGARSCFIFYKAYKTDVDDKVAINPRFAAITIIRRFPFVDFPHARALRTSFSSKQASKQTTQTLRPAEHNFRKIDNTRNGTKFHEVRGAAGCHWVEPIFFHYMYLLVFLYSFSYSFAVWLIRLLTVEMNLRTRTRKKKKS